MSGALTKVLPHQCGDVPGVCFIYAKKIVKCKVSRLRGKTSSGFTNEQSPQCFKTSVVLPISSPRSVGLLAEICWTKRQSPRYSPGVGEWRGNK